MSFPSGGLATSPSGDDPAYIDGIGAAVANNDFAFEAYFDAGAGSSRFLGRAHLCHLAAFSKWFGNSVANSAASPTALTSVLAICRGEFPLCTIHALNLRRV